MVLVATALALLFFHCRLLSVSQVVPQLLHFVGCLPQGFSC